MDNQLHIAFVWHLHQPLYKDRLTNSYTMPWVRLHAIKDYLDMVVLLERFENINQTFNVVPSLIEQIEDYNNRLAVDPYLRLSQIPIKNLSELQKAKILELFFDLNKEKMLSKFPRYLDILKKREALRKKYNGDYSSFTNDFEDQEYLDLTVLFNLAWFDYLWQTHEFDLVELIKKGENFTEEDRVIVINKQFKVIEKIIPEYRKLEKQGKIEITTTPYYHPILPLLCDSDSAKVARPELQLPENLYSFSDDAKHQIYSAIFKHESTFGHKPKGMWPSEQSVSPEMLNLLPNDIEWIISDEGILFNTLKYYPSRDSNRILENPQILYQPYYMEVNGRKLNIIFRDINLSDSIGFVYSKMDAQLASRDLYNNLKLIQNKLTDDHPYLVTIALDGENCWEHYENDGYDFLTNLYQLLSEDETLNVTTVSKYLEEFPPERKLENLFSGSWIRSDFTTWIGDPTKNLAWDYLYKTREVLIAYQQNNPQNKEVITKAFEEIYIAEGSDWFWWFGEGNSSTHDDLFDWKFRLHLQNVYNLLGLEVPEYLKSSLYDKESNQVLIPQKLLDDGWINPSVYLFGYNTGTMHQAGKVFEKIYYGHDRRSFKLKIEFSMFYEFSNLDHFDIYLRTNSENKTTFVINPNLKMNMLPEYKISIHTNKDTDIYTLGKDNIFYKTTNLKNIVITKDFIDFSLPYKLTDVGENKFYFTVIAYKNGKVEETVLEPIEYEIN
jgi:alpha-amylase/alpha-mannosidase (GH57 family)